MTRVLVVDDHALVRQSLIKAIASEPGFEVIGEAGGGTEAIDIVRRHRPDLVVLDISLPGEDGFAVAEAARAAHAEVKILFLTMYDQDSVIQRAVEMEVDGYVPKTATTEELLEAIKTIASGESYLSPSIARRVMTLARSRRSAASDSLTERELEVLNLLAEGAKPNEVAEAVFLSVKTVKNHLTNIYAKLGVSSAAQAVSEAYRRGLVVADLPRRRK